jgi:hypothetical protein
MPPDGRIIISSRTARVATVHELLSCSISTPMMVDHVKMKIQYFFQIGSRNHFRFLNQN